MAKAITAKIKLQVSAGEATPQPPVGPALGQHGVNIMAFVKEFNDRTRDQKGLILPVEISVFADRSFEFIIKTPPAAILLKKVANLAKGSGVPHLEKVGTVTKKQLRDIARIKMPDLNALGDEEAAMKMIAGTARSMGIDVVEE